MALFRLSILRRKSRDQQLEALSYKMQLAPSNSVHSYSSGMSKSRISLADKRYGEKHFIARLSGSTRTSCPSYAP